MSTAAINESAPAVAAAPVAGPTPGAAAAPRSGRRRLVIGAVVAIAATVGVTRWVAHRGIEATDDAQLDADVVAVPSRVGGVVKAVHFVDNQKVEAGALLIEIDDDQAKARLAQAEAELTAAKAAADAADAAATLTESNARAGKDVAKASLTGAERTVTSTADQVAEAKASVASARTVRDKAQLDLDRARTLVASGALPSAQLESAQASFDTAQSNLQAAEARLTSVQASTSVARARVGEASARLGQADTIEAQVAQARAQANATRARVATATAARDLAALDVGYTKIVAPRAGIVTKRSVAAGQLATTGQTVVSVVPTDVVWVTGNFKETQLAHMKPGQPATFDIDAYDGRELHGVVESLSGATGARFALLPPDNATGNFTKVVQRVPVRIKIVNPPPDLLLLPGLSVELSVNTRS